MFVEGGNFDLARQLFPEGGGGFAPLREGLAGQVVETELPVLQIVYQYYFGALDGGRTLQAHETWSGEQETEVRVLGTRENDELGEHTTVLHLPPGLTGQITIRENNGRLTTVGCAGIDRVLIGEYVEAYLTLNGTNIYVGAQAGDQRTVEWGGVFVRGFNGNTNYFMREGHTRALQQDTLMLGDTGIMVESIRQPDVEENVEITAPYALAA